MVVLDQPVSDISPSEPDTAPFKNSGFHLFPENTKYGGKELLMAFPSAMIVTVDYLPEVIACGFVSLFYPPQRSCRGVYWFHHVRPSVCRQILSYDNLSCVS